MDTPSATIPAMKVGVIGPRDSVDKINSAVRDNYPNLQLTSYIREEVSDAVEVFDLCQEENDGVFFTGIAVMEEVRKHCKIVKPFQTIPRSGYSLMSAIWEMEKRGISYRRISIDVVPQQVFGEVSREFDLSFDAIHSMPFSPELEEADYADRHRTLYAQGEVDVILTGFGSIYSSLKDEGLPVVRLYPNAIQIRQHLDRLIHSVKTRNLHSAGIAIQIIRIKGITQESLSQYDDLQKKGEFYIELIPYVRGVQGSLFTFSREEFIIFTTRGEIEREENRRLFRQLVVWGGRKKIIFHSGIGFGISAYDAEKAARTALSRAELLKGSGAYIVDDGVITGPVGDSEELAWLVRVTDPALLSLSEKTGINPVHLSKIKALTDASVNKLYDSSSLADALDVGERTARRILQKLVDCGVGEPAAAEMQQVRGRPRRLVRLSFPSSS